MEQYIKLANSKYAHLILVSKVGGMYKAYLLGNTNWIAIADTEEKAIEYLKLRLAPLMEGYQGADFKMS